MRVQVKLFATLGRLVPGIIPGALFEVELPVGATVDDLMSHLNLPVDEIKLVFVNGRARSVDWTLKPGDQVGLFPPVGGG